MDSAQVEAKHHSPYAANLVDRTVEGKVEVNRHTPYATLVERNVEGQVEAKHHSPYAANLVERVNQGTAEQGTVAQNLKFETYE